MNGPATIASPISSTIYKVKVIDSVGCVDSDYVVVNITSGSNRIIAHPADSNICAGSNVQLQAKGGRNYSWTPAEGLDNPGIANPIASLSGDMTYIVTATDTFGCVAKDTVKLRLLPTPTVKASSEGIGSKCEDRPVLLKASGSAQSYRWAPTTHLDNSNSPVTQAKPPVSTKYYLTGTYANGCMATDTVTAIVKDEAVVKMPDAFSPNGDSRNDFIRPMIFCDFSLDEFRIFDRWGREVYASSSTTGGWNGKRGDISADIGVYHYVIIGKRTSTNKKVIEKGNFLLMR